MCVVHGKPGKDYRIAIIGAALLMMVTGMIRVLFWINYVSNLKEWNDREVLC